MISTTIRHSILALGFITTVSGFALHAQAAAGGAAPALSFYPAHGWSANADGASCTIQSEYNNGFVVGFSGENANLNGLNIDFRQDIFDAGKTYDVGFRIPGGPPQKFLGSAESASMLRVNINSAGSLMTALRGASAFDVDVENNSFRFYLTGFATGAKNFEQCMRMPASGPAGEPIQQIMAAPEPTKAPPPPVLDAATADMPVERKELPEISVSETLPPDIGIDQPFKPPAPRERMSEKLAAQIAQNPDMVKIENLPAPMQGKDESIAFKTPARIEKKTPEPGIIAQRAEVTADFTESEPATGTESFDPTGAADDFTDSTPPQGYSISSNNWNLERATMRYNESQRELKRMGQQLQQERAQCTTEKQDLESQLFDPQVTAREQLAKLSDLEQKLADSKRKIENQRTYYEERLRILEEQKAAQ